MTPHNSIFPPAILAVGSGILSALASAPWLAIVGAVISGGWLAIAVYDRWLSWTQTIRNTHD